MVDCSGGERYSGLFIGNRYGAGEGPILLDNVQCSYDDEEHLEDCAHDGWGRHNCNHSQDVSVSCIAGITANDSQFIAVAFLGWLYQERLICRLHF